MLSLSETHITSHTPERSACSPHGRPRRETHGQTLDIWENAAKGWGKPNAGDILCFVGQGFMEEEEDSVSHLLYSPNVSSFCLTSIPVESDKPPHHRERNIRCLLGCHDVFAPPTPRQCLMHKWARCIRLIFDVRWESLFSVYIALSTSQNHVCANPKGHTAGVLI